jgi:hypothetical protein
MRWLQEFGARLYDIRIEGWLTLLLSALLVIVVGLQTCVLHSTDKTAHDALYAQRPWVASVGIPKIIEPLAFDSVRAHLRVLFALRNGGISPALAATAIPLLMIQPLDLHPSNILKIQQNILSSCTTARRVPSREVAGELILPRDTIPYPVFADTLNKDYVPDQDGNVSVWIIACVDYQDQFGTLHGIGGINTFRTKDGREHFKPEGTVDGYLQNTVFQVVYN